MNKGQKIKTDLKHIFYYGEIKGFSVITVTNEEENGLVFIQVKKRVKKERLFSNVLILLEIKMKKVLKFLIKGADKT